MPAELLETLLAEENVMDVVGALEYDPELAARQNHRQFLREHVIFKEVSFSEQCSVASFSQSIHLLLSNSKTTAKNHVKHDGRDDLCICCNKSTQQAFSCHSAL